MNIYDVSREYLAEFEKHYPQVPIISKIKHRDGIGYFHLSMRGDWQQPMTMDDLLGAIADFKRRGRQERVHHFHGGSS